MQDPREVVVRRLFALRALENTLGDQAESLLAGLFDEIVSDLARIDPTAPSVPRYRTQRAEKLLALIGERTGAAYEALHGEIRQSLAEVGRNQARAAGMQLRAALGPTVDVDVPTLSLNTVKALLDTDPIEGALLRNWFADQEQRTKFRVRQQIQLGMVNGDPISGRKGEPSIVERLRGRSDGRGGYTGGVLQSSAREATAIVRTAVNHVSNVAQANLQRANADIAPTYTIVATLDSHTSPICRARDGEVHRVDDPAAPRPPFHVSCRTITAPNPDWAALGLKPPPEGTRASATGQVPASTTYEDWLRDQSGDTQDEILGPARAALFRDGKIGLKDLVKTDGRRVPLEDLSGGAEPASDWRREVREAQITSQEAATELRQRFLREHAGREAGEWAQDVVTWVDSDAQKEAIKADVRAALQEADNARGRRLVREVAEAPPDAPQLYRGVAFAGTEKQLRGIYKEGSTHAWGISSFSSEGNQAAFFAVSRAREIAGPSVPTIFRLEGGGRAVPIEALSSLWDEREWYTLGRFEVVEVRQVGTFLEVTIRHVTPTW